MKRTITAGPGSPTQAIQRRIDVDLFVVSLNRLHAVASPAAEVADPRNVLPAALDQFSDQSAGFPLPGDEADQPATIRSVRNALEHGRPFHEPFHGRGAANAARLGVCVTGRSPQRRLAIASTAICMMSLSDSGLSDAKGMSFDSTTGSPCRAGQLSRRRWGLPSGTAPGT